MNEFNMLRFLVLSLAALILALLLWFVFISFREKESGTAKRAFLLSLLLPLPFAIVGLLSFPYHTAVSVLLISLVAVLLLLLFIPYGRHHIDDDDTPIGSIDQRDTMFSRNLLKEGSERFEAYYNSNPENRPLDDRFREKPGLLSTKAKHYHPFPFSAAKASFSAVASLYPIVEGKEQEQKVTASPKEMTRFFKQWALQLGAVSVGVTELKDYHYYSHVGRGSSYGESVNKKHRNAIAITVEMDKEMLDCAPFGPTVMETSRKYFTSGAIAVQMAACIREMGYPARAHIDGNYRVVCPLVARDAGLGEIGRMGLLMTPELGPRVRIAVVTTDLPLTADTRHFDQTMIDFCTMCKKCAVACPSKAISYEAKQDIGGVKRWQINSEACFTLWCALGTDCGRCMRVCPYSHPDNVLHRLVRYGIRNNAVFRRFAIFMDDFFYGKKPAPRDLPDWMNTS